MAYSLLCPSSLLLAKLSQFPNLDALQWQHSELEHAELEDKETERQASNAQ